MLVLLGDASPSLVFLSFFTQIFTGEATVSATDFWAGFLTPFLGPILGLLFNTATGCLQAFQEHAETQVLALL